MDDLQRDTSHIYRPWYSQTHVSLQARWMRTWAETRGRAANAATAPCLHTWWGRRWRPASRGRGNHPAEWLAGRVKEANDRWKRSMSQTHGNAKKKQSSLEINRSDTRGLWVYSTLAGVTQIKTLKRFNRGREPPLRHKNGSELNNCLRILLLNDPEFALYINV